jgi:tRNA G10  N-methylase Trm11
VRSSISFHLSSDALILDPFSGSATTVLEATIYGADSIGVDVSPLCVLQGKVKTQAWKQNAEIVRLSDRILRQTSWRNAQRALDQNRQHDSEVVRDFFDLAWMVVLSDAAVRGREHERSLRRNLPRMVRSVAAMNEARKRFKLRFGKAAVRRGDVRDLAAVGVRPESVDAIVTSPPYSIALDYVKNDHHALSALGETPDKARQGFIGVRGKPKDRLALYEQDMREAFHQMARALKPNSPAVVVVGDATRGMEMRTTREMIDWAAKAGLHLEMESPRIVYGLYNLIADEKILFFRKT